jgi:hypothetical protein
VVGGLLHSGGDGGTLLYLALAVAGAGMAGSFGSLMARVVSGVPVSLAADASGVMVTMVQLGAVVGIAAFGALYLNRAGPLPSGSHPSAAFGLAAGPAYLLVCAALAVLAGAGAVLAAAHGRAVARAAAPRGQA